jgi:hypothetical protein
MTKLIVARPMMIKLTTNKIIMAKPTMAKLEMIKTNRE